MTSKKLFAFVLGSLAVFALSLPVMAQSTSQSSTTTTTQNPPAAQTQSTTTTTSQDPAVSPTTTQTTDTKTKYKHHQVKQTDTTTTTTTPAPEQVQKTTTTTTTSPPQLWWAVDLHVLGWDEPTKSVEDWGNIHRRLRHYCVGSVLSGVVTLAGEVNLQDKRDQARKGRGQILDETRPS
jgi:hypothetical protein